MTLDDVNPHPSANLINELYPNDPRDLLGIDFNDNQEYGQDQSSLDANSAWLEKVYDNSKMSNFIDSMININNTVVINPASALSHVDDSPYCWVLLAYHSTLDHALYKELLEFGKGLSEYYYERCGVGLLDLAYPSNRASFSEDVFKQSPCILLRYPQKSRKMFIFDRIVQPSLGFPMNPIEEWGKIYGAEDLVERPVEIFHEIDEIYDEMHKNYKISSIYMEHYDYKIATMRYITNKNIETIHREQHMKAASFMKNGNLTEEEVSELVENISKIMEDTFKNMDLEEVLQEKFDFYVEHSKISFNAGLTGEKVIFEPRAHPTVEDVLSSWLEIMVKPDENEKVKEIPNEEL